MKSNLKISKYFALDRDHKSPLARKRGRSFNLYFLLIEWGGLFNINLKNNVTIVVPRFSNIYMWISSDKISEIHASDAFNK